MMDEVKIDWTCDVKFEVASIINKHEQDLYPTLYTPIPPTILLHIIFDHHKNGEGNSEGIFLLLFSKKELMTTTVK
jgi:hypothetical protein